MMVDELLKPEILVVIFALLGIPLTKGVRMGGHRPPAAGKRPTREEHHLMTAKICYVTGSLTVEELEASIEHVLKGGTLTRSGHISQFPVPNFEDLQDFYPEMGDPGMIVHAESPFSMPQMEQIAKF